MHCGERNQRAHLCSFAARAIPVVVPSLLRIHYLVPNRCVWRDPHSVEHHAVASSRLTKADPRTVILFGHILLIVFTGSKYHGSGKCASLGGLVSSCPGNGPALLWVFLFCYLPGEHLRRHVRNSRLFSKSDILVNLIGAVRI